MWKSYTIIKALPTIKQIQLIDTKKFVIVVLDANSKTFVFYVPIGEQKKMNIDFDRKTQIKAQTLAQVRALLFDKAFITVSAEYSDYNDVFSAKNVAKLLKNIGINEYAIELEKSKQLPFSSIYNLKLVKLEILKTYIKINLTNSFIYSFKSFAKAFILFN